MEQILLTMDFIHHKQIVHRDIKLDNILINNKEEGDYNVKIADFGMATFAASHNNGYLYIKCGTPGYVAPEILRSEGYTNKCDIFSMGAVFFNLLTGLYLFQGTNNTELLNMNRRCDLTHVPLYLNGYSESCKDLIL